MRRGMLMALALIAMSGPAMAQQWCDPRTKGWGCYERWCSAQGGKVDRRTTACTGGGGGGSRGYSGGGASLQMQQMQMMSNILANLMGSFIEAANQAQEIARRVRAEAEQVWARQLAEEQERLARAAAVKSYLSDDARQSMDRAKAMVAKLSSPFDAQNRGNLPVLAVYEDNPDLFGVKTLKPYYIGDAGAMTEKERRRCGGRLLDDAAAGAKAGVGAAPATAVAAYGEAYFLARQARAAREGGQLDVMCPPPEVGPGKNMDPQTTAAADKMLEMRNRTMEKMFERGFDDAERVNKTRQESQAADKTFEEAHARQTEAARKVEEIKARAPSPAAAPPAAQPTPPAPAEDPLLAEALAALRQSDEALAQAKQAVEAGKQALDAAQKRMEETGRMVDRMGKGADGLAAVNAQLFPGEKGGGRP